MQTIFSDYRVKTNNSGWILQKKRGSQWKKTEFFNSLEPLVDALLQKTFNERTRNFVHYICDECEAAYLLDTVRELLDEFRDEIRGVLRG